MNSILIYFIALFSLTTLGQENDFQKSENLKSIEVGQDSVLVPVKKELSNWGYGIGLSIGYCMLSDDLSDKFKNFISYGMSGSFEYKKIITLNLGFFYGASKTKDEIMLNDGAWDKNSRANFHRGEAYLGHALIDNNFIRAIPIFGIALTDIRAKEPYPYDASFDDSLLYEKVRFTNENYFFGLILDIKTNNNNTVNEKGYGAIRIKYSYYMPHYESKYNMFNGNIHSITVGISGLNRGVKKKN